MNQANQEESDVPRRSILNLTRSGQEETTDDHSSDNHSSDNHSSDNHSSEQDEEISSIRSLETAHQLLRKREAFAPAIKIPEDLYKNIKIKLKVLSDRDKIIQIKLTKYQKRHENLNMFIIIISSILGIYETFRVKIDDIVKTQFIDVSTNIIPIVLSGIITCTASIIKLKKYQEKSDQIHLTREKVSVARASLKTVQEHLLFCKTKEDLHKIKKIYFQNAFHNYCDGNAYLDKYVKEIDFHKYGEKINYSNNYPKDDIEIDIEEDNVEEDNVEDTNTERTKTPKTPKTPKFPKQEIINIERNKSIKI